MHIYTQVARLLGVEGGTLLLGGADLIVYIYMCVYIRR